MLSTERHIYEDEDGQAFPRILLELGDGIDDGRDIKHYENVAEVRKFLSLSPGSPWGAGC